MADLTPEQASARVRAWTRTGLVGALRGTAEFASATVGGVSVGQFMRDGSGDAGASTPIRFTKTGRARRAGAQRFPRRRRTDVGPVRILTGRLARAVRTAQHGRDGSVNEVSALGTGTSLGVRLTKGVNLAVVPEGRWEGETAASDRDLSYLAPAAQASRSVIRTRAGRDVRRSLKSAFHLA